VSRFYLISRLAVMCMAVMGLAASEHHGTVKTDASPIPGATVTAVQGDQKFITTTDDRGDYSFADLPDGNWTIQVESLGFAALSREVAIAPHAPSPTWELKLLSLAEVREQLAPEAGHEAPGKQVHPAPTPAPADRATAERPRSPNGGRGNMEVNRGSAARQAADEGGFRRLDVTQTGANPASRGETTGGEDAAAVGASDLSRAPTPFS
jgi:hypothetical protein